MAVVLSLNQVSLSHGAEPLFSEVSCAVHDGERLAIIGPNGSGKTSLLRLIAGDHTPEEGQRILRNGACLAHVVQDDTGLDGATVRDALGAHLHDRPAHRREALVSRALATGGFADGEQAVASLSGGWRKRLAISAALVRDPDLLLLDEPTNHLDLAGVRWLEDRLREAACACILVSHDRWFLDRVATRILEVNPRFPGGFFNAAGNYHEFLQLRQEHIDGLRNRQAALTNRHRRERAWLARQPKARTTKNVARIRDAHALGAELDEVARLNTSERRSDFTFNASGRRTQDLIVGEGLNLTRGGRVLFRDLDCHVGPGTRLGLIGGNGSGKSSLLGVLQGILQPDAGRVQLARELRVCTFDQTRSALDRSQTLRLALAPNGKNVVFGAHSLHVNAWAQRFLFDPTRLEQPVASLSGGEQARLLIAQLLRHEADVLILDEPTNDLDIPALEVLEEALGEFPGGVVLVTHDRYLLDRVCTDYLALEGDGGWCRVGSYTQWENHQRDRDRHAGADAPAADEHDNERSDQPTPALSYAEQKELRNIEGRIDKAEARLASANATLAEPATWEDVDKLRQAQAAHDAAQTTVDDLYLRWQELEERQG